MPPPDPEERASELSARWRELEGVYGAVEAALEQPSAHELERVAREMERLRAGIEEAARDGPVAPEGEARDVALRLLARHAALVGRAVAQRDARRAELARLGRVRELVRAYRPGPPEPLRSRRA